MDFATYNVSDLGRATAFYQDALGLPMLFNTDEEDWAGFAIGSSSLVLCGPSSKKWAFPQSDSSTERFLTLAVDDVEATIEALRNQDVSILVERQDSGVCQFAIITDPDGNRIWIYHPYNAECE